MHPQCSPMRTRTPCLTPVIPTNYSGHPTCPTHDQECPLGHSSWSCGATHLTTATPTRRFTCHTDQLLYVLDHDVQAPTQSTECTTPPTPTTVDIRSSAKDPVAAKHQLPARIDSHANQSLGTVPFLESEPVPTHSSFPAGICELRWAPASKAGSIHVVNSGEVPEQTGKPLLCVAVGRSGPHAARYLA